MTTPDHETLRQADAFKQAVRNVGGPTAAARAIGKITQQAVSDRMQRNRPAAPEWCAALERAQREKGDIEKIITREILRPDVFTQTNEAA